jgi:hypothetical protein
MSVTCTTTTPPLTIWGDLRPGIGRTAPGREAPFGTLQPLSVPFWPFVGLAPFSPFADISGHLRTILAIGNNRRLSLHAVPGPRDARPSDKTDHYLMYGHRMKNVTT